MLGQITSGILMLIVGLIMLLLGLKEDTEAVGGLKYRKLIIGGGAIFFGIIMILKSC